MLVINYFIPPAFLILNYITFFLFFRKKFDSSDSVIVGYLSGSILLILVNKIFLYFKLIAFYKLFISFLIISSLFFIFKNKILIQNDLAKIINSYKKLKNNYFNYFIFLAFLYILVQSIFVPPTNFDSFNYNLSRNYLFIMENTIYPIHNLWTANAIIMPLNSDLQYLTYASFNSDYFLNVPNFFGYIVLAITFYKLLKILKVNKENILIILLLFLTSSNLILSQFNIKNDLQITIYFVMILYFLFQIPKIKAFIPFSILSIAFMSGIKWTSIFLLAPIIPLYVYMIYKNQLFLLSTKYLLFFLPLVVLILPIDISYLNYKYTGSITGSYNSEVGNLFLHNDGVLGMLANLLRYFIMSADLVLPFHKVGLEIIPNSYDKINSYLQYLFFNDNTLGIANFIKNEVFFNYKYVLRPHSDFTFFGFFGIVIFITPFLKIFTIKRKYDKTLIFLGIFFILTISYAISWFPWSARYISSYFAIGCLLFATYQNNFIINNKSILRVYIILLTTFNLLAHVPQPIIKHSQTESWLNVFVNREYFKRFSIPEIQKVKKLKSYINDGDQLIIMMDNNLELNRLEGPWQSNYQILREFNNSYIKFVDENYKNLNFKNFKNIPLENSKIQNYKYLINFSKRQNFDRVVFTPVNKNNKNEYNIYLIRG